MTLVEFLRARLDDEAAEIAKQPDGEGEFEGIGLWSSGDVLSNTSYLIINKSRALRDVEAKRRIVDLYEVAELASDVTKGSDLNNAASRLHRTYGRAVRLLALPYADHPSFKEEWRP